MTTTKNLFKDIKNLLDEVCENIEIPANYFYYMAMPPSLFANVTEKIVKNGLGKEENGHWRRFIFEKPFGRDFESAKNLNAELLRILKERQIYRIDHYLGKETVQNILVFRFGNRFSSRSGTEILLTTFRLRSPKNSASKSRGGYYDKAGALRDMIPNHIFQLVTLTAMEPPVSFEADAVRDEQAKILPRFSLFRPKTFCTKRFAVNTVRAKLTVKKFPRIAAEENVDPKFKHRNFRRAETFDRQLALGGRSFLCPNRKTAAGKTFENRHSIQKSPVHAFPRHTSRKI